MFPTPNSQPDRVYRVTVFVVIPRTAAHIRGIKSAEERRVYEEFRAETDVYAQSRARAWIDKIKKDLRNTGIQVSEISCKLEAGRLSGGTFKPEEDLGLTPPH